MEMKSERGIDQPINFNSPINNEYKEKKAASFKINSQHLHQFFLLLTIMTPFFFVTMIYSKHITSEKTRELFWISFILTAVSFFITVSLVKSREKKLKLSVEFLVEERLKELEHRSTSPNILNTAHLQPTIINKEIEELKLQHEHHINLLQSSMAKNKEKVLELSFELERKEEEINILKNDLTRSHNSLKECKNSVVLLSEELNGSLKHKETLLHEYQETIKEQRKVIEKKQRIIVKLESKVHDLMYEIRSLLQLEESSLAFAKTLKNPEVSFIETYPSRNSINMPQLGNYDLSLSLKRYIKIAETEIGIDHLGYIGGKTPRFLDLSLEYSLLDIRSLFEKFKDEKGIVVLIDPKEQKALYANTTVKDLLGWSQEKFLKDFFEISEYSIEKWREIFEKIHSQKEYFFKINMKIKEGSALILKAHVGLIMQGPYCNHVIALLTL